MSKLRHPHDIQKKAVVGRQLLLCMASNHPVELMVLSLVLSLTVTDAWVPWSRYPSTKKGS